MQVRSCKSSGMEVSPETYNACTFEIIDKWDPTQHAKTCDTMFYLRDGTGAYVWDCDKWIFLDFTGYISPDWKAKEGDTGYIENKPFETLGNGFVLDKNGVLSVSEDAFAQADWEVTEPTDPSFIKNKPMIPAPTKLYQSVGEQDDGAITPLAVRKELYMDKGKSAIQLGVRAVAGVAQTVAIGEGAKSDKRWSTAIGNGSHTADELGVAIGNGAEAVFAKSVALGANSKTTRPETVAVNYGAINRLIEGVRDPEQPQDAATKNYVDGKVTPQVQVDWNVTDTASKAFIKNKPVIPDGSVLYPTTGDKTDGAMTQKSVTEELSKKANVTDLAKYVTLGSNQTITGAKSFTSIPIFYTSVASGLQGTLGIYLRDDSGSNVQRQTLLWANARLSNQTANGWSFALSMGANAILGGGESGRALLQAVETAETTPSALGTINGGHENAFLIADTNCYIGSGYQNGGKTGFWWKFGNDGLLFAPDGTKVLNQTLADKLYLSLTEPNHVLGETTFDDVKASSDTDGWVTITDRKNGFTGGTVKYKRHMNVVTVQGDNITCPALAQYSPTVICNIPDGARITDGKPNGTGHVSNVAMGFHAETNGDVYIHNSAALTTSMHVNFTFTYVV